MAAFCRLDDASFQKMPDMFSGCVINLVTSFVVMLTVKICHDDAASFKLQQFPFLF